MKRTSDVFLYVKCYLYSSGLLTKLIVVGGKGAEKSVEAVKLGFNSKKCKAMKDFPGAKQGAVALMINNKAIVCGGSSPRSKKCFSYDYKKKDWKKEMSLKRNRAFAQV